MPATIMSPTGLASLLAGVLAGVTEQDERFWENRIGPLERKHLAFDPTTNWTVTPTGTAAQKDALEQAVAIVRAEHPYVAWSQV